MNGAAPDDRSFGLYVHLPYCLHKCPYCDFNSYELTPGVNRGRSRNLKESAYLKAILSELRFYATLSAWNNRRIETIFFGGGTPSLFQADSIAAVIAAAKSLFDIQAEAEITLEANPGTLREELGEQKLAGFFAAGVNRISLGVQSFSDKKLSSLGRIHTAGDVPQAVGKLRHVGFTNFNLDLMFGVEGESASIWQEDLQSAIALQPPHLSTYGLTIEPGTEFANRVRHGTLSMPDDDLQADFYELTQKVLSEAGYRQYEISNFARPGFECRHNLGYWQGRDYLGLGAGAHSFLRDNAFGTRWANIPGPEDYIARVTSSGDASQNREVIDEEKAKLEFFFLRLRTREGVRRHEYEQRFGESLETAYAPSLELLSKQGLLQIDAERIALSPRGFLFANTVLEEFA